MTMEDTLNTESLVKSNFELLRLLIYYFWFLGEYGFLICQFLRYVRVNVYGDGNRNIKYHNTNHRNKIENTQSFQCTRSYFFIIFIAFTAILER